MANPSRTITLNVVGDSSGAQKALGKVATEAESTSGRTGKAFSSMFSALATATGGAFGPIEEGLGAIQDGFKNITESGKHLGGVMAGIGAAGVGLGAMLTGLGSTEQQADQQLNQAFTDAGQSMSDYQSQIDQTSGSMAKYGYTAVDVKNSLTQLVTATKNPTEALGLMQTAANLAALKHESLTAATSQLTQIIAGKGTKTLQSLGIQHLTTANSAKTLTAAMAAQQKAQQQVAAATQRLSDLEAVDHTKKQLTIADQIALRNAQDNVSKAQAGLVAANQKVTVAQQANVKSGQSVQATLTAVVKATTGQASAASDTWTGKLKEARAEIENQVSTLGQKYGPAMTMAAAGMSVLGSVTSRVSAILGRFKTAEGLKTIAEGADAAAEQVEAVGEGEVAAGEALALGPILLIIAAIALLGVGIYELVTHWKQVWGWIKDVVGDAWHFIDNEFIHPIEGFFSSVIGFIKQHWELLVDILTGPIGIVVTQIAKHFDQIVGFVTGIPGRIASVATHMWDGILDSYKLLINGIIWLWDKVADHSKFNIPSVNLGFTTIGGGSVGPLLPHIPMLAQGGVVTGPTMAMLGDNASGREAVIPLEKAGGLGFGGGTIMLHNTIQLDSRVIGEQTAQYVRAELGRTTVRNARRTGLA